MTRPAPRIGLWGFYAYGHFGDDLAAAIIGGHLKREHGADVRVYGLCEPYLRRCGFRRAQTIDELVGDSDLVVYGGGSTLESSPPRARRFGLVATLPRHAHDSGRVVALARERGRPIVGISIGGDGKYPRTLEPASKREFFEAARYLSVRYRDDLRLLRDNGKVGDYFPDLLWSVSAQFPRSPRRGDRQRIGINVYGGQLPGVWALLAPLLLYRAFLRRRDLDLVFIDSANATMQKYRALPRLPGVSGRNLQFCELDDDLTTIASLDALISTQLPLGVVAMSYGVPFFAVTPSANTRRLMNEIGLGDACFERNELTRLRRALASPTEWPAMLRRGVPAERERLVAESLGHLRALSEVMRSLDT